MRTNLCLAGCAVGDQGRDVAEFADGSSVILQMSDPYNRFVQAPQPFLLAQHQAMDRYFARAGGLAGQTAEDEFMTALANDRSAGSLAQGPHYCSASQRVFVQIAAFHTGGAVTAFAATAFAATAFAATRNQLVKLPMTPCPRTEPAPLAVAQTQAPPMPVCIVSAPRTRPAPIKTSRKPAKPAIVLVQI